MQNKAMNCAYLAMIKSILSCNDDWLRQWIKVNEIEKNLEPEVFEIVTR